MQYFAAVTFPTDETIGLFMGRHQAGVTKLRVFRAAILVSVLSLVIVAGWYATSHRGQLANANGDGCPTTLKVVTASSFAPVLATAARTLRAGTNCVQVDTKISEGRSAAAQVAELGADAWIPDDTAWTATIAAETLAPKGNGGSGRVLATSPFYLVTDPATAGRIKAAGGTWLGLSDLLTTKPDGMQLVVRDPSTSGDGMIAAGAVGEAVWNAKGMDASSLALADTEKVTRTVMHDLAATPEKDKEVGVIPEYTLFSTLGVAGPDRVYLSPSDNTAELRFTWLPTVGALADPRQASALERLLAAFDAPDVKKALVAAGLRGPDNVRPALPGADRLPPVTAKPFDVLQPHHLQHIFATWDPEDRRSNLLIVVDISSSSSPPSPPKKATSPLELLRTGSRQVANLLPDGSRLGLWEVGPTFDPPHAYRQLVPTARLDDNLRIKTNQAVNSMASHKAGPGLFDATVDAYRTVRDDFQPEMVNQVLVFTDDQNHDVTNAVLVSSLAKRLSGLQDGSRPVHLSIVLLGNDAGAASLQQALKPLQGYVGSASGADDIEADFIHVVAGGLHG
jgi:hypothetical protein